MCKLIIIDIFKSLVDYLPLVPLKVIWYHDKSSVKQIEHLVMFDTTDNCVSM